MQTNAAKMTGCGLRAVNPPTKPYWHKLRFAAPLASPKHLLLRTRPAPPAPHAHAATPSPNWPAQQGVAIQYLKPATAINLVRQKKPNPN